VIRCAITARLKADMYPIVPSSNSGPTAYTKTASTRAYNMLHSAGLDTWYGPNFLVYLFPAFVFPGSMMLPDTVLCCMRLAW
jgi:hypothetical protein